MRKAKHINLRNAYLNAPDNKTPKADVGTQTNDKTVTQSDQKCQTIKIASNIARMKVDVITQTISVEFPVKKIPDVIVEIPENQLETLPMKRYEAWSPHIELVFKKVGNVWKFNFIGAFLNFEQMDREEIIKVQKMLSNTNYEVCERAANFRRTENKKSVLSA